MNKKFIQFLCSSLLLLILNFSLLIPDCEAQWYQINLPVSGSVNQMQFINSNTGWATVKQSTYQYTLIKSTNSGLNWAAIYSDSGKVQRIQFMNDTLGYAMGYAYGNMLLKTTNGGYNWILMQYSTTYMYSGFYMINADTGWVSAFYVPSQVTLRTTNGFQTLQQISTGGGGTPATLYFFKEKYNGEYCGYISGAGTLFKTTNGAYNWQQISFSESGNVNSFSFINKDTGWVVYTPNIGNNSKILYTLNSGQNWNSQFYSNLNNSLYYIQSANNKKIWCGTIFSKILVTTDAGLNWGYQISPITSNAGLYMFDTLLGFAWSNLLVRTTNGGGSIMSVKKLSINIQNIIKLEQNFPNPFNNTTNIKFQIPKNSFIDLKIYDVLGREIITLINENQSAGIYEVKWDTSDFSSGIYFYILFANNKKIETKRMVCLK